MKLVALAAGAWIALTMGARPVAAQRAVTFRFTPTLRAQIAVWVESADGARFATVRLTAATALRGIGNRPGASQMNSGYHWPYGRREGVLPVWAHRRAAVPGALLFPRVIFQDRTSEGFASRTSDDSTPDSYFCLSFSQETTKRSALDAISCASPFTSDKGRFLADADIAKGYAEPREEAGVGADHSLDARSLYPPRRDVTPCTAPGCRDSPDLVLFSAEVLRVMPDIDAITMATPPGETAQTVSFTIPAAWPDGDYLASVEINTEGDYNAAHNETVFPTPTKPAERWDAWAISYGYPFRGQPSVVFRLPIAVGTTQTVSTMLASGYGSLSGQGATGGAIFPLDANITNDPVAAPGSGVDRLRVTAAGYRLRVETTAPSMDTDGGAPDVAAAPDGAPDSVQDQATDDRATDDRAVSHDGPDDGGPMTSDAAQRDGSAATDSGGVPDAATAGMDAGGSDGRGLAARGRGSASGCGCATARNQSPPGSVGRVILSLLLGAISWVFGTFRRPRRPPPKPASPVASRPSS